MKKTLLLFTITLGLIACYPVTSMSATPFSAPAVFDLAGSEIGVSLTFETTTLGQIGASLTPNPAPVTGNIRFSSLNQITGAFSGAFESVSASTMASVSQLEQSFPITLTINSDQVTGWFIWQQNAVIFDVESISATLAFGEQSWVIPFDGVYFPAQYENSILSINAQLDYSGEYSGRTYAISMAINLIGVMDGSGTSAQGKPWIDLKTDRQAYQNGETLTLTASAGGPKPNRPMDVYMALIAPDGTIYFAPTYTTTWTPMLTDFFPQNDFYVAPFSLLSAQLPSSAPPIMADGTYNFAAAFVEAGTTRWVSDIELTPFVYQSGTPVYPPVDGLWYGSGVNNAANGECADLAWVMLEITNGKISGEATENVAVDADGYELTGTVNQNGEITDGILWEEFGASLVQVGVFTGKVSGSTIQGNWHDAYGCYGTYTVTKSE